MAAPGDVSTFTHTHILSLSLSLSLYTIIKLCILSVLTWKILADAKTLLTQKEITQKSQALKVLLISSLSRHLLYLRDLLARLWEVVGFRCEGFADDHISEAGTATIQTKESIPESIGSAPPKRYFFIYFVW